MNRIVSITRNLLQCTMIIFFVGKANAQNIGNTQDLLSVPGIAQALADAAKSMKAAGFVYLDGKIGTGMNN